MKKMIFFTSLITTFTTAGAILAVTGSPVKAADLEAKTNSHATLSISTQEELQLVEVPDFDFGRISIDDLGQGKEFESIRGANLSVLHATAGTNETYEGWKLSAKIGAFSAGTNTLDADGGLHMEEVMPLGNPLNLFSNQAFINGPFVTVAERKAGIENPGSVFGAFVSGKLYLYSHNLADINNSDIYTATINWHLGHNHMEPSSL